MENPAYSLADRLEKRFLARDLPGILEKLNKCAVREEYSGNDCVHTIYFDTSEHEVPFEHSIKARKYVPSLDEEPEIDLEDNYILDVKTGMGLSRNKERSSEKLKNIPRIITERFPDFVEDIKPYILVQYRRKHFVLNECRITIDTDVSYYKIDGHKTSFIGREEDFQRLEIKIRETDGFRLKDIEDMLGLNESLSVISKKGMAYSFLAKNQEKGSRKIFKGEIPDHEIESKLSLEDEETFQKIKEDFKKGVENFTLPEKFPYTVNSSMINLYCKNGEGEMVKVALWGGKASVVKKIEDQILHNDRGLNCIIKRKEAKERNIPITEDFINKFNTLAQCYKGRKAFWVYNKITGRIYHISADHLYGPPGLLRQLEVEYTGRYYDYRAKSEDVEKEIVKDISNLTKYLLENFKGLSETTLTKKEWLLGK